MAVLGLGAARPDTGTTWWHHGKRGHVRIGYRFLRSAAEAGAGILSGMTGPIAELLGCESIVAPGLLIHLDSART